MKQRVRAVIAIASVFGMAACSPPTLEEWNEALAGAVKIRATAMSKDGASSTSVVCVEDLSGGPCIKALMTRTPYSRSRAFYAGGKSPAFEPGSKGNVVPYVELDDQEAPQVRMNTDLPYADLDIVINGDLAFATGSRGNIFSPNEDEWRRLRNLTASDQVVVRLSNVEHHPHPYATVHYPLAADANREFAMQFVQVLKIHDSLNDALASAVPAEPSLSTW